MPKPSALWYNIFKFFVILTIICLVVVPALATAQGLVNCGLVRDEKTGEVVDNSKACTLVDALNLIVILINLAIQFAGLVAVVMLIFAGGDMVDAGVYGDSEKYENGK